METGEGTRPPARRVWNEARLTIGSEHSRAQAGRQEWSCKSSAGYSVLRKE